MKQLQRSAWERGLYAALLVAACAILGAMLFIWRSGNQMIDKITPLTDATMEVGMEATIAHLWLMEAAVRENHQYFDTAKVHLQRAEALAVAMLEGGVVHETKLSPLDDPTMRRRVEVIRQSLRHLVLVDHDQLPDILLGHEHDDGSYHTHDLVFADLLTQTAAVEEELRQVIRQEHSYFRHVQLTLFSICIGFFILVGAVLYRYISAQKRYEARIKRLNLILRAVRNVNHLITREKNEQRLIQSTCELLVETRGLHNAWITLVDETGRPTIHAEAGLNSDFAPAVERLLNGHLLPCCIKAIKHDGVLVIEDPHRDCPECPLSEKYTGRSGLAARLQHANRIYGFMVVSSPRDYAFDREEHNLFEELAEDIALSLHLLNVEREQVASELALRESEKRYRTLAANIPGCDIYLFDNDMRYLVAEGSEMKKNGLRSDFYEGKTLYETWEKPLIGVIEPLYQSALAGKPASKEYQCCGKFYFLNVMPVFNGQQKIVGGIALSQNISERKRSEEAIKRSENILRHTFEAIPDLISVHDRDYNIVLSNWHQRPQARSRYRKGQVKCHEAYMGSSDPCDPCHSKDVFKDGKPVRIEKTNAADGITREINVYPVFDEFGNITMTTEHIRDITERKRAEKLQAALFSISEATNLTTNLTELLMIIHETLGTLIDTTNFYVALYDDKNNRYSFPYCVDEYDSTDFRPEQLERSLTDYVRRSGRPLLADEKVHKELQQSGQVDLVGKPSLVWLGVPLTTSHGVIGVVVVQSYTDPNLYSRSDMDLMTFVSGHITMAIERKLAEEALRTSEERLRAMYEQASVGVALLSTCGRWLTVNERLCNIVGYTRRDLLKMTCRDLTHPDDQDNANCIIDQLSPDVSGNCSCEKRFVRKDGEFVWVHISAAVVTEPARADKYLITIIQDITERKNAEDMVAKYTDRLIRANRELEAKQAELEEFIYTVSHDLKAPIVSISGFTGLIRERLSGIMDQTSSRHLDRIRHNTNVMESLIGDLLELSRIGRTDEPVVEIDMEELADEVLESFGVAAAAKSITVTKTSPLPGTSGRRHRIRQLLTNLIDNAIKYMPEKDNGKIEIGFDTAVPDSDGGSEAYYIRDNGQGIPEEFHERIFGMFQRAPSAGNQTDGTGVGLTIVRRIVQKHGGRIWVTSKAEQGSTFYFTLPVGKSGESETVDSSDMIGEIEYMGEE
ncbi:MAG: PAS domain S-box protein [Candidatus Zixiibacteriota bacterium]|nr:MAG: PAS domain S-box protein [candidate division Zixibacteria bacterium]